MMEKIFRRNGWTKAAGLALLVVGVVGCSAPRSPKYQRIAQQKKEKAAATDEAIEKAKKELETGEKKYSADERFKMAQAYLSQRKIEQAVKELNLVTTMNDKHEGAWLLKGEIALALRRYEDANLIARKVLSFKSRSAGAHRLLAQVAQRRGLMQDAIKEWQATLSLAQTPAMDFEARRALITLYTTLGMKQQSLQSKLKTYQAALRLCNESLTKYPKNEYFLIWKGDLLGKMGRREEAIKHYDQVLATNKSAGLRYKIAEMYLRFGIEPERTLKTAREAVQLMPKDPRAHVLLGRVHLSQNRLDDALAALRQAQKLAKGKVVPEWSRLVASILVAKRQIPQAEEELQKVIKAYPRQVGPLLTMAGFYVSNKQYDLAIEQYQKALQLNPNLAEVHFLAAEVYMLKGDADNAIKSYEAGLKIRPDHAGAANNLAYLYAERKIHLDDALRLAEKANRAAKERHPAILDTVGFVHYQREDYDKALKYLTLARDRMREAKMPPNPTILYHLAMAHEKKGARQAAIETLEEALRVGAQIKQQGGEFKEAEEAEKLLNELKSS
ncbi:MAG: tetratricopeptide repeat protein [Abditibacteriales bacterium]|nr:tetratricopeptide repeat protein [Abditibacteriales bacterium]MDW8365055.1 tetratricopeptide repeat protein [Abditibacteriales bacterium]